MQNLSTDSGDISETVTVAHLTDAHLTSPADGALPDYLNKRMFGLLSWQRRRRHIHRPAVLGALVEDLRTQAPDHIAITGDLTQVGLPAECRAARAWLDALARPEKISLVPGNHDRYARSSWDETLGLWAPYMASDEPEPFPGAGFPTLRRRGPAAVIGVSSSVPTPWFMATGTVGREQAERLGELLSRAGQADLFRIVLIHHTPVPGSDKWRKRLTDARAVAEVIATAGAELVLHGHTHRLHAAGLPGTRIPVVGLSSASADDPREGRSARYGLWTVARQAQGFRVDFRSRVYRDGLFREATDFQPLSLIGSGTRSAGGSTAAA
jgi:3',5'-cyclic AMP phosphodiesterase CpdA